MMGSNGRSRAFTSRNRGVVASAWLFQSEIPTDSNSRPTVFNGSNRQLEYGLEVFQPMGAHGVKAYNGWNESGRRTLLPESFPVGTEFANVQGVPVSCTRNGICRAWDRAFPIESFIYKGTMITEEGLRQLDRKRQNTRDPLRAIS